MMERIRVSSSISNFREKLLKRTKLKEWTPKDLFRPTIFFGAYHWGDWARILLHRGRKTIFFCGSDILALKKHMVARILIRASRARFICENEVEHKALAHMGIDAEILPMIFDETNSIETSYKHSDSPRAFATYHKWREKDYGYFEHPQLDWFCDLSEKEFNEKIKEYQGCARFNTFDGFAESLARSVLMGQYQYSIIPYKHMTCTYTFDQWINSLKDKKAANIEGQLYWKTKLEENLWRVLS